MLTARANGIDRVQCLTASNKDMSSPEYSSYYKFSDQTYFNSLCNEIAPEFQSKKDFVSDTDALHICSQSAIFKLRSKLTTTFAIDS